LTTLEVAIPGDHANLLPIGDLHLGDKAFKSNGLRKLKGYLDWARQHEATTRIFLMGDIFNCASRVSKTSPFETDASEYDRANEIFGPYRDLIIGGIDGNHEFRWLDLFGFSPMKMLCQQLGATYCGYSAAIKFRVGIRPGEDNQYHQIYWLYAHHTRGGSGTVGNAINKAAKLQDIVCGMDAYLAGHNHQMATGCKIVYFPMQNHLVERKIHFVDCGSYLEWDGSYAEAQGLAPSKLGSPKIRLSGERDHHDIHVSI